MPFPFASRCRYNVLAINIERLILRHAMALIKLQVRNKVNITHRINLFFKQPPLVVDEPERISVGYEIERSRRPEIHRR